MVPRLTCGLLRSNFAFATAVLLRTVSLRLVTLCRSDSRARQAVWMDLDRTVLARTRDGGTAGPHHPDCAGYGWPRGGANPYSLGYGVVGLGVPVGGFLQVDSPGWRWRASAPLC